MPDRIRKIQVRPPIVDIGSLLVKRATDQAKIKITTVLIAVAKFESTCATPTFASTAVSPAKNAESKAQVNQFISFLRTSLIDERLALRVAFDYLGTITNSSLGIASSVALSILRCAITSSGGV